MKTIISIALIFFWVHAKCQFVFVNSKDYYDREYFQKNGKCYTYAATEQKFLLDSSHVEYDYYRLEILNLSENLIKFVVDESGIFLPYQRDGELGYVDHIKLEYDSPISKEQFVDIKLIPKYLLDTIDIVRDRPVKGFIKRDDHLWCFGESENEHIRLVTLKTDRIEYLEYRDMLVSVEVELRENDYIDFVQKKEILCPEKIDANLILALNNRLIEYGYLEEKLRNKYVPEVKEGLIEFQQKMQLNYGFIDIETLILLKISGYGR